MYKGLYDIREGLSEKDAKVVGAMTARLLFPWDSWMHRRVERITFCDEDALRRDISLDLTLPNWFHDRRGTPRIKRRHPLASFRREPVGVLPAIPPAKRQLVPLGFLRKGVLINFSLRDEQNKSLPLLNTAQNAQVAEALLTAIARTGLQSEVPAEIRCDIRNLVTAKHQNNGAQRGSDAEVAYTKLLTRRDSAIVERERLADFAPFFTIASTFIEFLLALTMLNVHRQQRRIIHLSYEESLWNPAEPPTRTRLGRGWSLAKGEPRVMVFEVPAVADADSYHLEIEAPEGHMVSKRESYQFGRNGSSLVEKSDAGSYRRAHFHFSQAAPGSEAGVAIDLLPRPTTIVRSATFTTGLALLAMIAVGIWFQRMEGAEAAAAVLLSFTGLIGTFVIRNSEDAMATSLLLPLRILAMAPVALAFMAAIVVLIQPGPTGGHIAVGSLSAATGTCGWFLIRNWREVERARRL